MDVPHLIIAGVTAKAVVATSPPSTIRSSRFLIVRSRRDRVPAIPALVLQ